MTALPSAPSGVGGRVTVPGSKSESARALVLAALADAPSTLHGVLRSRDTELMVAGLRQLGAGFETAHDDVRVAPGPPRAGGTIDCGLAGTVMRFLPPVALLADGPTTFVGDGRASERPMRGMLDGLRSLGADIDGDAIPFTLAPAGARGGEMIVDASDSSQFVTGPLLTGARLAGGLVIRHVGPRLPSLPHIHMTMTMLRARGVHVEELDEGTWRVAEGPIAGGEIHVAPDLTNAAVFLGAAAVAGGEVSVPGWPEQTDQPGAAFLEIAQRMGCEARIVDGVATLTRRGPLTAPGVLDLRDASELTPVVAALAAVAAGTTTIVGVEHIRGHETDRIAALATELARAGVDVEECPDGLRITGGRPRPATFRAYADHRMVHFAALLGLVAGASTIDDMACVGKTMPDFPQLWSALA